MQHEKLCECLGGKSECAELTCPTLTVTGRGLRDSSKVTNILVCIAGAR